MRKAPVFASLILLSIHAPVRAQCLDWKPGFGHEGAFQVRCATVFDDGTGPAVYVGGSFTTIQDIAANFVAKWDGVKWSALGAGTNNAVYTLAVFDDGSGPQLYAGGTFTTAGGVSANRVARWNGSSWSALSSGTNDRVFALAAFDDGTGPALYAGGLFTTAGGFTANRIARWKGSAWTSLGSGVTGGSATYVFALTVFDDGSGSALYAGGSFTTAGSVAAGSIARWKGSWSAPGSGVDEPVYALKPFDDGSGPALYVGGSFLTAGGAPVAQLAKWDGSSWSGVGGGIDGADRLDTWVQALNVFDDGGGPFLYAGGGFAGVGGVPARSIARWDGAGWSALGSGVGGIVSGLVGFDPGTPQLVVVGDFSTAGGSPISSIASFGGTGWTAVGQSEGHGLSAAVHALATFDDGTGPALYAGGIFNRADGATVNSIARWNGSSWSPVRSGLYMSFPNGGSPPDVRALAVFDDGTGPALYLTGRFDGTFNPYQSFFNIVRWDGTDWSGVGTGIAAFTGGQGGRAMAVLDDGSGPALYVGGLFSEVGNAPADNIAKWDGTSWSALGSGLDSEVDCLAVFDDGSGPRLYAGGAFQNAGGTTARRVARWDGTSWAPLGTGFNGQVFSLAAFDDGGGPKLYASGNFTTADGAPVSHFASWNGSTWSSVGGPFVGSAHALVVFDDGSGPALYAGGYLTNAAGTPANGIARWDGSTWSALGNGTNDLVSALAAFDDGSSPALYVGGDFQTAGATASYYLGAWRGCAGPGTLFCPGDGSLHACPCANSGAHGHGCQNSAGTGGALLTAAGTTSPDTVVLQVSGELPHALTVFIQGNAKLASGVLFGDGVRCVSGTLKRLYAKSASGGSAMAPVGSELSITARSAALGDPIAPGEERYYQAYSRDPNASFCPNPPGNTFNASNGIRILW